MASTPLLRPARRPGARIRTAATPLLLPILAWGCGAEADGEIVAETDFESCVEVATRIALPDNVPETSGVAIGRRDSQVVWTHNDSGGEPVVYALSRSGAFLGQVRIAAAVNVDWEDMEISSCSAELCLYLADVGDNREERDDIVVYRVAEPAVTDAVSPSADAFRMRYPDRPRDAEAIFVLPGERLYVVTKGRSDAAAVYRYPGQLRSSEVVTLEKVQELTDGRPSLPDQVTGASASPDGSRVAVRSYTGLSIYAVTGDHLADSPLIRQSLGTLMEAQGEAVALGQDGLVVLTSEAARGSAAAMSLIRCRTD